LDLSFFAFYSFASAFEHFTGKRYLQLLALTMRKVMWSRFPIKKICCSTTLRRLCGTNCLNTSPFSCFFFLRRQKIPLPLTSDFITSFHGLVRPRCRLNTKATMLNIALTPAFQTLWSLFATFCCWNCVKW